MKRKRIDMQDYWEYLRDYRKAHPHERSGQSAFNAAVTYPKASIRRRAEELRGTHADPFYRDENEMKFYELLLAEGEA